MDEGKLAKYHALKRKERAVKLAKKLGISEAEAAAQILLIDENALKALGSLTVASKTKAGRSAKSKGKSKPKSKTAHDIFCEKVRNAYVPLAGGAPGLGKRK
ncbi:MAG: hypothetical protein RSG79_19660 [Pseudomonas sp.]